MNEEQPPIYDERLSCKAMPSVDNEGNEEIEIADADGNKFVVKVATSSLKIMKMPRAPEDAPAEVKELLDAGIGLGLVACKVLEKDEFGLAKVEIPTLPSPTTVTVSAKTIARKI